MTNFIQIDDTFFVAPQIELDDLDAMHQRGFKMLINNRPDSESVMQVDGAAIRRKAESLGIAYRFVPIGGLDCENSHVDQMAAALDSARGRVLAYCRSGTRSSLIWALAEVKRGRDPHEVVRCVEACGFPTRTIRTSLAIPKAAANDVVNFFTPAPRLNSLH